MFKHKQSLSKNLARIPVAAIVPMFILSSYLLWALSDATNAYSGINNNISYANKYVIDFKERIDYTMYLAVIGNKSIDEIEAGKTTVNGIVTINPYLYIKELEAACNSLSLTATVNSNKNQIKRVKNTLNSLNKSVWNLESNIKNRQMVTTYLVTLLVVITISAYLTTMAVKSVTTPVRKLCAQTSRVAKGDFTANTKVESVGEIATLTSNFNYMTQEIGLLVEDIKHNKENIHLIEMKLLQAQINPHFLYNTLDTIVWLAEEKKTTEVVSIVTYLSDFFHTTLSKGKDFITIQEEELHVDSYMKIQKFRYQDVMDYEISIDKELYPYTIPKLMLQPLAENALIHGVRNKRSCGHIYITGRKDNGNIIFQVTDDGRGMKPDELQRLRQGIANNNIDTTDNSGFGIVNVNQRIQNYYGNEFGISFESEFGKGTTTIVIAAKNIQTKS